jgi:pilus assembly protein Flp/PilA
VDLLTDVRLRADGILAMRRIIRRFLGDRRGATAIEYGLIVAVLSLAVVAGINSTHNSLENMFIDLAARFDNAAN